MLDVRTPVTGARADRRARSPRTETAANFGIQTALDYW
jgi:hypothetical protein